MIELSRRDARQLMLAAQGLDGPRNQPAAKADVLEAIRRMGALQIDTISVVNRSPYFVLWSRLGQYDAKWLEQLHEEGALFEYWAHAACFIPIEDYPLYVDRMKERDRKRREYAAKRRDLTEFDALCERVLTRIREQGPVVSADFERTGGRGAGWWDWKIEKSALEWMFNAGDLMIPRRRSFQRVYDLRERVLPEWDDSLTPPQSEVLRTFVLKTVKALGVALPGWVRDYFHLPARGITPMLQSLEAEGLLERAEVEGLQPEAYIHTDHLPLIESIQAGRRAATGANLLSPFDPLVWDRKRALALFGFDYIIECYTPEPKRKYGYFTLPILHNGALVGRLDAKAHRRVKLFEVKTLHLEPGVEVSDDLARDLADTLRDCAAWHATPDVVVRLSDPPAFASRINRALA